MLQRNIRAVVTAMGRILNGPLRRLLGRRAKGGGDINLALQGGGAHGAFTWGVLDALLEVDDLGIAGLSGASAGAVNAVALAAGWLDGGRAGARVKLAETWQAIAAAIPSIPPPLQMMPADLMLGLATRLMSPYQFNPLDVDPLRDALARLIDFARLRRHAPLALHIAATDVANGRPPVFGAGEITIEVVLASACLPHLRQAVRIGERHYWDGGYSANPPLLPLVFERGAADTLIVLVDPVHEPELPTSAPAIARHVGRLTFNAPLRRDIELIEQWRLLAGEGITLGGRRRRRLRRHRFHLIAGGESTRKFDSASRLYPDRHTIEQLRDAGRASARAWLDCHLASIGKTGTVDLAATFL